MTTFSNLIRATLGSLFFVASVSCSLLNRVGPDVTCSDLENGLVNACTGSVIASCPDGQSVSFEVCDTSFFGGADVCAAPWQVPGSYRCADGAGGMAGSGGMGGVGGGPMQPDVCAAYCANVEVVQAALSCNPFECISACNNDILPLYDMYGCLDEGKALLLCISTIPVSSHKCDGMGDLVFKTAECGDEITVVQDCVNG